MCRRNPGFYFIQDTMRTCVWVILFGLSITGQAARSEEGPYVIEKGSLSTRLAGPVTSGQSPYQTNHNAVIYRSRNTASIGASPSSTSTIPLLAEPKTEDNWSVNIQRQIPAVEDCPPESSLQCIKSSEDRIDTETHRDSFWFVLRKVFHF
jgi:hypothetical protein